MGGMSEKQLRGNSGVNFFMNASDDKKCVIVRKGRGTIYYLNGDRYVGEWNRDKPDGKGTYYYTNGDK